MSLYFIDVTPVVIPIKMIVWKGRRSNKQGQDILANQFFPI